MAEPDWVESGRWQVANKRRISRKRRSRMCWTRSAICLRTRGESGEYVNLRLLGELVARAALERTESRGAHFRIDFPETDDARWKYRVYQRRTDDGDME